MTILVHDLHVHGMLFVLSYIYSPCCVIGKYVITPAYIFISSV